MQPLFTSLRTPLALAITISAAFSLPTFAQTPPKGASNIEPNIELDAVVVTATRTPAASFDVPASIDVVNRDTLQNSGNQQINLSETLNRVPGLVAQNRQNYAQDLQISSRGFGTRSTFGVRGLRLFADGIPATMPDGQGQVSHIDLSSATRVEVLRGPFSALYGNSSGGVISVFTETGQPGLSVTPNVMFGSYGTSRLGLKANGASGNLDYVVDANTFKTNGYRDHSQATRDNGNAKLRWKASEATTVTFIGNAVSMQNVEDPLGLTRAEVDANPKQATGVATQFNTRKSVRQTQGGVIVEHRLAEGHSLRALLYTGQRDTVQYQAIPVATQAPATSPGGVIDLDRAYWGTDLRYTYRGQLAGRALGLTLGMNYDNLKEGRKGFLNYTGVGAAQVLGVQGALRRNEDNRVFNFDQYAQAEWQAMERLRLSAGIRQSSVKFSSKDQYIVVGNGDDSGSTSYRSTTPVVGATVHVTESINAYASAGKGFETPTFNELSYRLGGTGLNFNLKPARSNNYELGVKARFSEQLRFNAALFASNTRDEIVTLTNTGGRATFQNVSRTERRGAELAVDGAWQNIGAQGGTLSYYVAATLLNAQYKEAFLTCTAAPCAAPTVLVAAGKRLPGAPANSAYAEIAWKHAPSGFYAGLEGRRVAKVFADDLNTDAAPAYTTFNLRAGFEHKLGQNSGWTLRESLRIDNFTNRNYIGSVIVNEGNQRYFEAAPKRNWTIGLSAAYKFD